MSSVPFSAKSINSRNPRPCHSDKAYINWVGVHTSSHVVDDSVCHAGADFAVSLGIIVHGAADTIMTFHPHHHNETALCDHVKHTGIAFTFSILIVQEFQESSKHPGYIPQPVFTWACTDIC